MISKECYDEKNRENKGVECVESAEAKLAYYEPYKSLLPKILAHPFVQEGLWQTADGSGHFKIDETAIQIKLPHLGPAKHALVFIVEMEKPGEPPFSCVIKQSPDDYQRFLDSVITHPAAIQYLPFLYDVHGGWAVLERVYGLEKEELEEKLAVDQDFVRRYANTVAVLLEQLMQDRLFLNDVQFSQAHNCMINPMTAEVKFVELSTLIPADDFGYTVQECIANQLFEEVPYREHEGAQKFLLELLKTLFKKIKPESLFVRSQMVVPGTHQYEIVYKEYIEEVNRKYEDALDVQTNEQNPAYEFRKKNPIPVTLVKKGDPNYEKIFNKYQQFYLRTQNLPETLVEGRPGFLRWGTKFYTETFSPDLIAAVQNEDYVKFKKVITSGKITVSIKDPLDPRFAGKVLS